MRATRAVECTGRLRLELQYRRMIDVLVQAIASNGFPQYCSVGNPTRLQVNSS
jgi:hypothetical protein